MTCISSFGKTLLIAAAAFAYLSAPAVAAEITYLANEGFLLTGGGQKVLVDALFGDGLEGYAVVPPALRARLEAAQPPFDGVDLVLATHFHDDHFDPRAVGRFLTAAPEARFASTPQAVERLRTEYGGFDGIAPRVRAVLPAEGVGERLEVSGVALTVYNLHHGRGRPIENLGFLVAVGGTQFLHVGDTVVDEEELAVLDLPAAEIDLALFPEWYLRSAENVAMLQRAVAPERLGAMHVPTADAPADWFGPGGRERLLAGIEERAPGALLAVEPGASTEVGPKVGEPH